MGTIRYNIDVVFNEWINMQYIKWRGDSRKSLTDYAKYLGVSQPIMNQWINTGALPGNRTLPKLADKYPEVYEILGFPVPRKNATFYPPPMTAFASALPPTILASFEAAASELEAEVNRRSIPFNSPEAAQLAIDIMAKHGWKHTSTENNPD